MVLVLDQILWPIVEMHWPTASSQWQHPWHYCCEANSANPYAYYENRMYSSCMNNCPYCMQEYNSKYNQTCGQESVIKIFSNTLINTTKKYTPI